MSQNEISPKEIAQAIVSTVDFLENNLENNKQIPAWTTTIQKVIFFLAFVKK